MISTTDGTVHVVDPDETTLKSISFLLRELGYVVNGYSSLDQLLSSLIVAMMAVFSSTCPCPGPETEIRWIGNAVSNSGCL